MTEKVVILGTNGMLGHMMKKVISKQMDLDVRGLERDSLDLYPRTLNQIGTKLTQLIGFDTEWVINCMGATKPYFNDCPDLTNPLYVNAIFPHQLSQWGQLQLHHVKVIHITTDCVYDGCLGKYDERFPHSAQDLYGKSKSIGEPKDCMVLRTSIIGPEVGGRNKHFLSWVKSQDGKRAKGFTNHQWNGLTTLELSYAVADIICAYLYEEGIYHLFSNDVTKYEMVKIIGEVYGLDIDLEAVQAEKTVDRRLRSVYDLNDAIEPHKFREMIEELKQFEDNNA